MFLQIVVFLNILRDRSFNFLFFCYYNNEVDIDFSAFVKLSNNMFVSEKKYGPVGLTDITLILKNEVEFNTEIKRLNSIGDLSPPFKWWARNKIQ